MGNDELPNFFFKLFLKSKPGGAQDAAEDRKQWSGLLVPQMFLLTVQEDTLHKVKFFTLQLQYPWKILFVELLLLDFISLKALNLYLNTMLLTTESTTPTFLFTSESVGEGHPDKVCDQIADAILDACLEQDPLSKVAIEAAARPGLIFVFGVLDTQAQIDIEAIVRVVLQDIGYDCPDQELDYKTCKVMDYVERRNAPDTDAPSLFPSPTETEAAGDQGIIFGYASNETPQALYVPG